MRTASRVLTVCTLLVSALLFCSLPEASLAQRHSSAGRIPPAEPIRQWVSDNPTGLISLSPKRPGHYTARDWQHLIDSLWGEGIATSYKLQVFDAFWNGVDQTWGGFPNLVINWDSLRTVYRPLVEAGVSRGRFAGILSRLTRELLEWHVGAMDREIDATMGLYPDLVNFPVGYPNYSSFHYVPGVPIVNINILFWRTNFGAGLTLLDDGRIMVYNAIPNHPLGLQPGDIILGYDGMPWKQAVQELFDAELPILSSDLVGNWTGSTLESANHEIMISAGMNWGLFDTIDVVKYSTKDTVHYPTSLLSSVAPPYLIATEQMPVSGVPFPDLDHNKLLSWGIVQGTNVGYIYGWDWSGNPWKETQTLFTQAVDDLLHQHRVDGLILDFRTNPGGWPEFANGGFAQLFNFDPTSNYSSAIRVRGSDHYAFTLHPGYGPFVPGTTIFDHPIAVLTGPLSGSSGDYNAFRLRFHPMARSFGRPTCGAYTDMSSQSIYGTIIGSYFYRIDDGSVYSNVNDEGLMIHKTFPVDEEVWLTQEGVVSGEDDVVKRALEWISTLTYSHDVAVDRGYARPGVDSVCVTARLTDPLNHSAALSAIITDTAGVVYDSLQMFNDGAHGDSAAGDSVWGCYIPPPPSENFYAVSVRTEDLDLGTYRRLPNVVRFTTGPPVVCVGDTMNTPPHWGESVSGRLKVNNQSAMVRYPAVRGSIRSLDTMATVFYGSPFSVGDLMPGQTRQSSPIAILFSAFGSGTKDIPFELVFSSQGSDYWLDTLWIQVTPVVGVADEPQLPAAFELSQNYPNPFNPSTTIEFSLPVRSHVTIAVFNLVGERVATLLQEEQEAGHYEVQFDAGKLASGMYVYRLTAGGHTTSRTMLLMK